jgi:hypothetical protein
MMRLPWVMPTAAAASAHCVPVHVASTRWWPLAAVADENVPYAATCTFTVASNGAPGIVVFDRSGHVHERSQPRVRPRAVVARVIDHVALEVPPRPRRALDRRPVVVSPSPEPQRQQHHQVLHWRPSSQRTLGLLGRPVNNPLAKPGRLACPPRPRRPGSGRSSWPRTRPRRCGRAALRPWASPARSGRRRCSP